MKKGKVKTMPWDATEHLKTKKDLAAYLGAAIEDGDPVVISAAIGDIARAKGMSQIARETGLGRESLYKAPSPDGNPEFATILKVVRALGLKLRVEAAIYLFAKFSSSIKVIIQIYLSSNNHVSICSMVLYHYQ